MAFDATPLLGRPTGVGAFCIGALDGLARLAEVDVSAYAVSWRRRHVIGSLVPSGVSVRQHAMPARPLHTLWGRSSLPPVEWFIGRHDVVHGTNFVVPPTSHASRVVTVHDLTVILYPQLCDVSSLAYPGLIRRAVAGGAWIHTPSQFVADQVIEEFDVDPDRVRAVHHGIAHLDGPGDPDAALPFNLPVGCQRFVLAIGTIEPRKDYPSLVEAFSSIASTYHDLALVIVGADGWGVEAYEDAVRSSSVASRIVRPGYLSDAELAVTLGRATMLAYPSVYEGFGFPPLQAMAAGIPVVTTVAGAVPEVVGGGALLVEPGDPDSLGGAMETILVGGRDVELLVERGRQRSAAFSWDNCAGGLADLYRDAIAYDRRHR